MDNPTPKIRYAKNQNDTDNNRTARVNDLRQIVSDEYDPATGTPRQWVYWFLHQSPNTYSRSDRDDLIADAEDAALAHDAETAARNLSGRTRVTYERYHYSRGSGTRERQPFFEALESNEWLGDSTPDNGTAASWAESWADACETAEAQS